MERAAVKLEDCWNEASALKTTVIKKVKQSQFEIL
jgi:hypothetical protein